MFNAGIDIGSTTIKVVVTNEQKKVVFSEYVRHNTDVVLNLRLALFKLLEKLGDIEFKPLITGSVGMGLAEKLKLPFIQEVIASAEAVSAFYPDAGLFIDIGGEDAKLMYFRPNGQPDIRMNGNCAGGTGAYIDQMASLLNISLDELDKLALQSDNVYPVSSRCGVFAKTDIQSLLSRQVTLPDIARSVFHAVAVQVVNTLLQGDKPRPKVIMSGGPLVFSKALQQSMIEVLNISPEDIITPAYGNLFPALGAAISNKNKAPFLTVSKLAERISSATKKQIVTQPGNLKPLFKDKFDFEQWQKKHNADDDLFEKNQHNTKTLFIGIDAGSSTTKLVAINNLKKIVFSHYTNNKGNTVQAVENALGAFHQFLEKNNIKAPVRYAMVTGYGEELVKKAFGCDESMVETIAHYKAAAFFNPDVSFILDIGGQDIKAMFIKDGHISNIEVNEACSSGCGTFIETFAGSLGLNVESFAKKASFSQNPFDLGSRCTVFMNSKLKQAMREGAQIEDISAGLAYSVIKNSFNKVLKIKDTDVLGDNIVVQGGTFLNPAVLKATEQLLGKKVTRPSISALMGAFGCALTAMERSEKNKQQLSNINGFQHFKSSDIVTKTIICKGCGNHCRVNKLTFPGNRVYFSGNRCEKIFSNHPSNIEKGTNLISFKYDLIFKQLPPKTQQSRLKIGIPRVLNMYDNFPFWNTLFNELNFEVVLSSPTSELNHEKAYGAIMSDNICYPAKLVHAHIYDLISKKVDRIFYPVARYEKSEFTNAVNAYNCPVVTGYPDVIKNTIAFKKHDVTYDMLPVSFNNETLLSKACYNYLKQFGVDKKSFQQAFRKAKNAAENVKRELRKDGKQVFDQAQKQNKPVIMLVGRPYHADPAVNHNIPDTITEMGVDVITEDVVPENHHTNFKNVKVLSQWQYSNRIYHAMEWAGKQKNLHVIQLNSFGCGPDAVVMDEARDILKKYNKHYTGIRIDDGNNAAPVKLRIRSLIESLAFKSQTVNVGEKSRKSTPPYLNVDRKKKIIGPNLSQLYSLFTESLFYQEGYDFELLPEADRESVETGLKYVNNDMCYPAVILIGDIIKALQSGKYDLNNVAVAMSETGGPCRASNYVALVKKAMLDAGFSHIPVISVSTNPNTMNEQPGFKKKFFELLSLSLNTLIYSDALLKMYNFLVVREKIPGSAKRIYNKYIQYAYKKRRNYIIKDALELLKQAVEEFNAIEYNDVSLPKVGIVGEIFMKYNRFGNYDLENWLRKNGLEVVTSPLNTFFVESLADIRYNNKNFLEKDSWIMQQAHEIIGKKVDRYLQKTNTILEGFHHQLTRLHSIYEIQKNASEIVSLSHQYGEGWLLPGEMISFIKEDVQNIISVQPFGCIACHIVSKGISKRMKTLFPDTNTLFLDIDADTSEANMHNRLEFFVKNAIGSNQKTTEMKLIQQKHIKMTLNKKQT